MAELVAHPVRADRREGVARSSSAATGGLASGDLRGRLRQTDCALPSRSRSHEYRSADAPRLPMCPGTAAGGGPALWKIVAACLAERQRRRRRCLAWRSGRRIRS